MCACACACVCVVVYACVSVCARSGNGGGKNSSLLTLDSLEIDRGMSKEEFCLVRKCIIQMNFLSHQGRVMGLLRPRAQGPTESSLTPSIYVRLSLRLT